MNRPRRRARRRARPRSRSLAVHLPRPFVAKSSLEFGVWGLAAPFAVAGVESHALTINLTPNFNPLASLRVLYVSVVNPFIVDGQPTLWRSRFGFTKLCLPVGLLNV
jgi:hypothetical protein